MVAIHRVFDFTKTQVSELRLAFFLNKQLEH
jgi:hypothetical protein